MTERLLDANEVASMLNVPVSWVRESTRSGAMPVVELGRYKRYRETDVLTPTTLRSRGTPPHGA